MSKHIGLKLAKQTALFVSTAGIFMLANANNVTPPPLPLGSHMVKQHIGINPEETTRNKRAHHHNKHHKKDVTRDDTLDEIEKEKDNSAQNTNTVKHAKPAKPSKSK
jgi:hypothetical protein